MKIMSNFTITDPNEWVNARKRLPRERENVLIYGPFNCHNYDIQSAFYHKYDNGNIFWYHPGCGIHNHDYIAEEHEVHYWRYYPEFQYPLDEKNNEDKEV